MTVAIKRQMSKVTGLEKLLPGCQMGIFQLQNLVMHFSTSAWKDLFIYLWQQQIKRVAELKEKIQSLGQDKTVEMPSSGNENTELEAESIDPIGQDKVMLLHCIDHQTQLLVKYSEVLRNPLSLDMRMVLQRHQLQIRDMLERLSVIGLSYHLHSSSYPAQEHQNLYQRVS